MAKAPPNLESLREDAIRTTTRYIRELDKQEAKLDPALSQTRKERKQLDVILLDLIDKKEEDMIPGMESSIAKPDRPASLKLFAGDIKGWAEKERRSRGRPPSDNGDDEGEDNTPSRRPLPS